MKILILDNYDSFTYNLVHIVLKLGFKDVEIHRNNKISLEETDKFDKIILSPGPGLPSEAGILMDLIKRQASKKSILGVCLGHQAIGEAFGGELYNLSSVIHGKAIETTLVADDYLFENIPQKFETGRYHSWAVKKENLPTSITVTAEDDKGVIMALKHNQFDIRGVQFHPESIMTEYGEIMISNWLNHKN